MAKGIQRDNLYREITDKIIAELEQRHRAMGAALDQYPPALPLGASGQWPDPPQLFRHQYPVVVVCP